MINIEKGFNFLLRSFFPLNYFFEVAPLWILDKVNYMRKNIGQGVYAIKKILLEFQKASNVIKSFSKDIEADLMKYVEEIDSVDAIEKLKSESLEKFLSTNIVDEFINKRDANV